MSNKDKQTTWEKFAAAYPGVSSLQPLIREDQDDESYAFEQFVETLPESTRPEKPKSVESQKAETLREFRWFLCDMPDGDYPKTHCFDTVEELAAAINRAEGRSTTMVAFYGVALPFTKTQVTDEGKRYRYLMLPNEMALTLGNSLSFIERSLLPDELDYEDTGWMGDPAFLDNSEYFNDNESFDEDAEPFYDDDPDFDPSDEEG